MKQQIIITLSALLLSTSALANGGFEPNKKQCANVGKELVRVSGEMKEATSGLQKSWLKRQRSALETKRSSCGAKGFSNNKSPTIAANQ